ncbi:MAG TPA: copper resistance protein CopC [Candidatus Dormibacteraeota bacterium]|nr:copper resistance protein CopC [Candidatus Dormibacteraeota bacterium]
MRRLLVGLAALLVALGAVAVLPLHASAHALRQGSVPDSGANLPQAPPDVTITFGEEPDARLSSIEVLSTGGQPYQQGATRAVPGNPLQLRAALRPLPTGVYTVSWRTFSHVDGHVAGGAFSFGVRQDPSSVPISSAVAGPPGPSATDIAGRALLFVGLAVLVGGAGVATMVLPRPARAVVLTLPVAWALAVAGTATVVGSQAHNAGTGVGDLLSTSIGRTLLERTVPLAITGGALLLCFGGGDTRRRTAVAVAGAGGALAMLADVLNSHAAAGSAVAVNAAMQWVHIAAGALWVGGLLALLLGIRGLAGPARGRAVRRFSTMAGVALVAVAATGTVRAVIEVGAWDRLWGTTFGILVLVKVGLLLLLAGLGAVNRLRHVPVASRVVSGLRRVGSAELMVAVAAMLVAAGLVNEAPPTSEVALAARLPQPLVLDAHDYGTSVRMRLTITPGSTGPNRFSADLTDYDTGRPVDAAGVQLGFAAPSCQSLGPTTLPLTRSAPGTWTATGSNLALGTSWQVTALVDRGIASVEIPVTVTPKVPPQTLTVQPEGNGLPTLYNLALPVGKLQMYIDPEIAGKVEFHATYFDATGNGLDATVNSIEESGRALPLRPLGPGHYVADAAVTKGTNTFDIAAVSGCQQLNSHIDITVKG